MCKPFKAPAKPARVEKRYYRCETVCGDCDRPLTFSPTTGRMFCWFQNQHDAEHDAWTERMKAAGLWDKLHAPLPTLVAVA